MRQKRRSKPEGPRSSIRRTKTTERAERLLEDGERERAERTTLDAPSRVLDPAPSSVLRPPGGLLRERAASVGFEPGFPRLAKANPVVGRVQASLKVGAREDPSEHEADQVADRVVSSSSFDDQATGSRQGPAGDVVARKPASGNLIQAHSVENPDRGLAPEEEEPIQRKVLDRAPEAGGVPIRRETERAIHALEGSGQPLPGATRAFMESRFGADFGRVRVHSGSEAARINREFDARAFTRGSSVFFGEGEYAPGTDRGKRLLAHELTHVVQQGAAGSRPGRPSFSALGGQTAQRTPASIVQRDWQKSAPTQGTNRGGVALGSRRNQQPTWTPAQTPGGARGGVRLGIQPRVLSVDVAPKKILTDGATTAQATVKTQPAGRPVTWGIDNQHGATISPAGVISVANNLPKGMETAKLNVTATDQADPTLSAKGEVELWNKDYERAERDYNDFVAKTYKFDNFRTANGFGRFDVKYDPSAKRVDLTVKVKFEFPDGSPAGGKNAYINNIRNQIQAGWSGKFPFENVRYPNEIWKKLNPVQARVKVRKVNSGEHFLFRAKTSSEGTANVNARGVVTFFKGDQNAVTDKMTPETVKGELQQFKKIAPQVTFERDSAIVPETAKTQLKHMATYLKRMNVPKFDITVKAKHERREPKPLANQREKAVIQELQNGGVNNHNLLAGAAGERGNRNLEFKPAIDPGFKNTQNITLHEFGHMLGLDDEYAYKSRTLLMKLSGKYHKTDTYDLNKKAFGKEYAQQTGQLFESMDVGSASLMEGGSELRAQHYVTIWDAFVRTAAKATPPAGGAFTHDDWKIKA
ncbi:MAG: DUF4157 domain-containing protein [Hyphomicrobiales bacterium]